MRVFVLDKHGCPLMPCHAARARELLKAGRAVVHRRVPFTIRLTDRLVEHSAVQPVPGDPRVGLRLQLEVGLRRAVVEPPDMAEAIRYSSRHVAPRADGARQRRVTTRYQSLMLPTRSTTRT